MTDSWWANKLAGNTAPPASSPRPYAGSPTVFPHAQNMSLPRVPQVTRPPESLSEALALGAPSKGGDGARVGENSRCPMCGSDHFITFRTVTDDQGHRGPAPRCFACGYTQHLPIQGAPPA